MTTNTPGPDITTLLASGAVVFLLLADASPVVPDHPPDVPAHVILLSFLFVGLIFTSLVLMVLCSDRKEKIRRLQRKLDNLHSDYVSMQHMYIDHINRLSTPTSPPPPDPPYVSEPSIVTVSSRRFLRLN